MTPAQLYRHKCVDRVLKLVCSDYACNPCPQQQTLAQSFLPACLFTLTTLLDLPLQGPSNQGFDMVEDIWGEAGPLRLEAPAEPDQAHPIPTHFPHLSVGGAASNSISPQSVLTVQGDVTVSGGVSSTTLHQTSDRKAKCNITPATHPALSIIDQLQVHWYNLKQDPDGQKQLGVLAHEVRALLSDAVKADKASGLEQVNSHSMLYLAIQAIKQLSNQFKAYMNGRLGMTLVAAQGMTDQPMSSDANPQDQGSILQLRPNGAEQNVWPEGAKEAGLQQPWILAKDTSEPVWGASNIVDTQEQAANTTCGGMHASNKLHDQSSSAAASCGQNCGLCLTCPAYAVVSAPSPTTTIASA